MIALLRFKETLIKLCCIYKRFDRFPMLVSMWRSEMVVNRMKLDRSTGFIFNDSSKCCDVTHKTATIFKTFGCHLMFGILIIYD